MPHQESTPGRCPLGRWLWIPVTFLLILVCILYVDIPLAGYLHKAVPIELYVFCFYFTRLADGRIWMTLAGAIYLTPNYIWPGLQRCFRSRAPHFVTRRYHIIALYIAAVFASSGLLVNVLKIAFGRPRPLHLLRAGASAWDPGVISSVMDAFPSGHSQAIWSAMFPLALAFPRLRPLCLALAVAISATRLILVRHYLSDVIAGTLIAVVIAIKLKDLFERRLGTFDYSEPVKRSC
jgi:membrane-associated phospholipid phosphatase